METIHLKAIVFDRTQYWSDGIGARGERIHQTYLFDASRAVHCCELTPSYELHPLYATPLVDDDEGSLSELMMPHESHEVEYYHVRSIDRTDPRFVEDLGLHEVGDEETVEEVFARLMEHYRGNVVLQMPKPELLQAA
ncbi:hypothetical protein CRM94_17245 [Burkholderia gladioli]|uniref:Uncharacterized protein n=1 Tax=Burkholderia gladioli TaxID=28095 RepID=A0A2A7SAN7_BURGA|nr:hypothetical protein [Burkholderia gladioli]PEH40459.1 hypothetical protein CRM94_17245 [Burkholderia gladioli]